jgi:hypothetical protein
VLQSIGNFQVKDELRLWKWRYVDQFGKRRIYPCRLSEEDANHLQGAERGEGSIDQRLAAVAAYVVAEQGSRLAGAPGATGEFPRARYSVGADKIAMLRSPVYRRGLLATPRDGDPQLLK